MARAASYVRYGDIPKALAAVRRKLQDEKADVDPDATIGALSATLNFAAVDVERAEALVRAAIEEGAGEQGMIRLLSMLVRAAHVPAAELAQRTEAELRGHPLALAALLRRAGRRDESARILRDGAWQGAFERAMRHCLARDALDDRPDAPEAERRAAFDAWAEEEWPALRDVLPDLAAENEARLGMVLVELGAAANQARHWRSPVLAELEAAGRDLAHIRDPNLATRAHAVVLARLSAR